MIVGYNWDLDIDDSKVHDFIFQLSDGERLMEGVTLCWLAPLSAIHPRVGLQGIIETYIYKKVKSFF